MIYDYAVRNKAGRWDVMRDGSVLVGGCSLDYAVTLMQRGSGGWVSIMAWG